jgi:hypothetical protein
MLIGNENVVITTTGDLFSLRLRKLRTRSEGGEKGERFHCRCQGKTANTANSSSPRRALTRPAKKRHMGKYSDNTF